MFDYFRKWMSFTRSLNLFALLLLSAFAFVGCKEEVEETTPLTMICEATFPPYEYHVKGGIDGIDPALATIVAKCLGRELIVQDMTFDSIIPAVSTGKADIAASGITVTEARKRQVLFSSPYVEAAQVAVVKDESPHTSLEALKTLEIGVQSGSTGDVHVTKHYGDPSRFQNVAHAITAVRSGKVDVAVVDKQPAEVFVATQPGLRILKEPVVQEFYAFAFSKQRAKLCAQASVVIEEMDASGVLAKLHERYTAAIRLRAQGNTEATAEKLNIDDLLQATLANPKIKARLANIDAELEEAGLSVGWWANFKSALHANFIEANRWQYLLKGFLTTVEISFFAVLIGLVIGFIVAVIRTTHDTIGGLPIANAICKIYLTVIRGTPVVVQLLIIYFVIFGSVNISKVLVAVVAFGFNSGAYVSEILRAGIQSIDKGQMEAGRSLGLSYLGTMRHIVLPQAFRNVLPALGNEFIVLLKETSVAGYIALMDLTKAGDIIRSQTYTAFLPLLAVAGIYLIVVSLFTALLGRLERRLHNHV